MNRSSAFPPVALALALGAALDAAVVAADERQQPAAFSATSRIVATSPILATSPRDAMPLVEIAAGPFRMGSAVGHPHAEVDEFPQHTVSLDRFWIDRHEVTNAQFTRFVAATGHRTVAEERGESSGFRDGGYRLIRGASWRRPLGPGVPDAAIDDHPVVAVAWTDADAYCRWAGRRLPTEAEWEKAARGIESLPYPWGATFSAGDLANLADRRSGIPWATISIDDGYARTAPAGSYPAGASPYGVLDMAGNAWEWVQDWYDTRYYTQSAGARNPSGPASGDKRVMRGGSHYDDPPSLRAARRTRDDPDHNSADGGFRCAQSALPPAPTPEPMRPRARMPIALRGAVWRDPTSTPVPSATRTPTATSTATAMPDPCAQPLGESYGRLSILGSPSDRPAADHPDLNLALRGYVRAPDAAALVHIDGPTDPVAPPQLFGALNRVPRLTSTHRVIGWLSNRFVGPITDPPVTLLGFETTFGEPVRVPDGGREIGEGFEVLVLYATEERLTLKYTREDIVTGGYTLHYENVCTDRALLALYRDLDRAGRRALPAIRAGQALGRARSGEILVSIRDGAGSFLDPRSCKDWWQGRCPPRALRVPGWQDTSGGR